MENALGSQSRGRNTRKASGNEILHPALKGAILVGINLAALEASAELLAEVGSVATAGLPSKTRERSGSSCGWRSTSSSDSNRYLPAAMSRTQALKVAVPCIHGIQRERCGGTVTRSYSSAVTWAGTYGSDASVAIAVEYCTGFYRSAHVLSPRIFSYLRNLELDMYRDLPQDATSCGKLNESATYRCGYSVGE